MVSLLMLLIIVLVVALLFGAWQGPSLGYAGWSPLGLILLIIVVLWATGNLR